MIHSKDSFKNTRLAQEQNSTESNKNDIRQGEASKQLYEFVTLIIP